VIVQTAQFDKTIAMRLFLPDTGDENTGDFVDSLINPSRPLAIDQLLCSHLCRVPWGHSQHR
jgi:hypothetical protein